MHVKKKPRGIRTGIRELDTLLNGGSPDFSIPFGSSVLLRGGPGSGKTTLSLQILSNFLTSESASDPKAVFVSCEHSHDTLIALADEQFGFNLATKVGISLFPCGYEEYREITRTVKALGTKHKVPGNGSIAKHLINNHDGTFLIIFDSLNALLLEGLRPQEGQSKLEELAKWRASLKATDPAAKDHPGDTSLPRSGSQLTATDDVHMKAPLLSFQSDRAALYKLIRIAKNTFPNSILIFIGEEHQQHNVATIASESFLCDIEILLGREAISGHMTSVSYGGVGYAIERRLTEQSDTAQAVEIRSFCRVLKCRSSANQSRRCSYEIRHGVGLTFHEIFPGDGKILLFAENEPQRITRDEFFKTDIPHNYPALRFEHFDRSALQRTFASQRGFQHMPAQTDLYLGSFDTYWVSWFLDLCQKWRIADQLQTISADCVSFAERQTLASSLCDIHQACVESLESRVGITTGVKSTTLAALNTILSKLVADFRINDSFTPNDIASICENVWNYMLSDAGSGGLLKLIPKSKLRLFGELRSEIIWELGGPLPPPLQRKTERRRNVHRCPNRDTMFRSVPYNANVSFLVQRDDVLTHTLQAAPLSTIERAIREIVLETHEFTGGEAKLSPSFEKWITFRAADIRATKRPRTWEEVIALCRLSNSHLLVETQTFDSFLCFFLEVMWGCGGIMDVSPGYTFAIDPTNSLIRAFSLITIMFRTGVIPRNCSVEPDYMSAVFAGRNEAGFGQEWLYARHWYSTFVDILTHPNKGATEGKYVWRPRGRPQLSILPLPSDLQRLIDAPKGTDPRVSCWGEWHFAMLEGSENQALGVDIINNLMSSQKVCERAELGAALPTVEEFYKLYGANKCFDFPERRDLDLPMTTFNELREQLFERAISRSSIFDYRHCMRKFHAILKEVHTSPGEMSPALLRDRIERALLEIADLRNQDILRW